MQDLTGYGKIISSPNGWVTCPFCRRNKQLKKIFPDESADRVAIYCKDCKRYVYMTIKNGQCFDSRCQQDAS